LIRAAVHLKEKDLGCGSLGGIVSFFFDNPDDFPQLVAFTKEMNAKYNLGMRIYETDFLTGLKQLLKETNVQGIFLGTRRGDPNAAGQETYSPSSEGWPVFMRINPIIEWTYHDVWEFLKLCKLPYCHLYDEGYTSLGSVHKTLPNAALEKSDGNYAPAHLLQDPRLERAGRSQSDGRDLVARCDSLIGKGEVCTAGILIIGDEILSAKVDDLNMRFLCKSLRSCGWLVKRVYFVQDDVEAIAECVASLSNSLDAVLTSGGLGPTLDDMTMSAVAKAIGRKIISSSQLEQQIRNHFGDHVTDFHLKMAQVPDGPETVLIDYKLQDGRPSPFPLVRCRNIYILPGVPSLVAQKWPAVMADLPQLAARAAIGLPGSLAEDGSMRRDAPFSSVILRLNVTDEASIASPMHAISRQFGDFVSVGSYPLTGQSDGASVALSLEGKDESMVERACAALKDILDPSMISSEHRNQDSALHSPVDAPTLDVA